MKNNLSRHTGRSRRLLLLTAFFLLNGGAVLHAQKPKGGATPAVKETSKNDMDKDGVPDVDDVCPALAGPVSNKGCPVEDAGKPAATPLAKRPPAGDAAKPAAPKTAAFPTDIAGQVRMIIAAAPDDFRAVRKEESKRKDDYGDDIWDGIFMRPGINDPAIVRTSKYGTYYVMPVVRGGDEATSKTKAAELIPMLKSTLGGGARVSEEEENFGDFTVEIRTTADAPYIEITRQGRGGLTVFVHKK